MYIAARVCVCLCLCASCFKAPKSASSLALGKISVNGLIACTLTHMHTPTVHKPVNTYDHDQWDVPYALARFHVQF